MKMCRDPEDARDVLQDTLLAMARSVRDFRGASSISTWLYTIARSFCIKKRRRSKFAPEPERSLDTDAANEAARPGGSRPEPGRGRSPARKSSDALEQAIGALEPMYREVLLLRDVEGLSAAPRSPRCSASACRRSRAGCTARAFPCARTSRRSSGSRRPSRPAALPGTCPDVLALFSRHPRGRDQRRRSAPRWSATSQAAAAAAAPATRSSARWPSAARAPRRRCRSRPGLGPRRGPELPRGNRPEPFPRQPGSHRCGGLRRWRPCR